MFNKLRDIWSNLNKTIYTGERLRSNMRALTFVSAVTAALGLVLVIINIQTRNTMMLVAAAITLLAGLGCGFCTHVMKNREIAVCIPTIFCVFACTVYLVTGAGKGSAILWSLLIPIGICYFVSVKYGIIMSTYYTVLYAVVFYTPLRVNLAGYYTEEFMERFPLLYASLSIFTGMAMIQYHRAALFEIEHTNILTEEVEHQTAVVKEQSRRIEQMSFQTIQTLANAIDAKDPYTKGHSSRVSLYSALIAGQLGWDKERIDDLKYAALLHDIGKIGVPDSILNSPHRLSDIEYEIIKSHTTMGRDMLKGRIMIRMADDVAAGHHERYDGKGYPAGLASDQISEESRIVAIADAFDAMSSDRVYRKACSPEHIRKELTEGKGKQFDPRFTDVFIDLWDRGCIDSILKENESQKDESDESPSVLLREVVETFVSQNAKEEIDITTGIMSRTAGEAAIAQSMKNTPGCFVFFDVDNLKKINDIYGHEAGDRILHLMGDTLMINAGSSLCCRLGGDEFLLFMKDVSEQGAEQSVKKIINDFEQNKKDDPEISIASLSAGMVMSTSDDTYTDIYNKADKALYHVKQNGKSGFSFYDESFGSDRETDADVNSLVSSIRTSGSYKGAMNVEYREFTKLYEFVSNLEQRFAYSFKLIMINLKVSGKEKVGIEEFERSAADMEQAIRQNIRDVDVLTRYGNRQFLVILLGTDNEGATNAVNRIFRGYYKMNGGNRVVPSYSVADPDSMIKDDEDDRLT